MVLFKSDCVRSLKSCLYFLNNCKPLDTDLLPWVLYDLKKKETTELGTT